MGFTLIEIVTVIGVLVITSAVLLVNNRLNEAQLSLNKDAVGIASAVSRARALTLQNLSDDICGYGVRFDTTSRSYLIFKDIKDTSSGKCDDIYKDSKEILPGQESQQNLGNGIIFYNPGSNNVSNLLITDVVFYSSDAKVKLTNFNGQSICPETSCDVKSPAGMVIIQTEALPYSFKTLKITTTGQVTTKNGKFNTIDNFDDGVLAEDEGVVDGEEPGIIEDCIRDCSCAAGLATGGTCSDTCGGTCYAGGNPQCTPLPTDCQSPNNTCGDSDFCGAPCSGCSVNFACVGKACLPYNCTGKNCGDIADGSGLSCEGPCPPISPCPPSGPCPRGTCEGSRDDGYQCVVGSSGLRLDSIWPPETNKAQ